MLARVGRAAAAACASSSGDRLSWSVVGRRLSAHRVRNIPCPHAPSTCGRLAVDAEIKLEFSIADSFSFAKAFGRTRPRPAACPPMRLGRRRDCRRRACCASPRPASHQGKAREGGRHGRPRRRSRRRSRRQAHEQQAEEHHRLEEEKKRESRSFRRKFRSTAQADRSNTWKTLFTDGSRKCHNPLRACGGAIRS